MTVLLDVNVLMALIDPGHVAHDAAHAWFERTGRADWATCSLTENGVMRILGHPRYPNTPRLAVSGRRNRRNFAQPSRPQLLTRGFQSCWFRSRRYGPHPHPAQVTDTYLLALAASKGGQLATFDRKLSTATVRKSRTPPYCRRLIP